MAWPVVVVAKGLPVTDVANTNGLGTPIEEAANGFGTGITYVDAGGIPVVTLAPAGEQFVTVTDSNGVEQFVTVTDINGVEQRLTVTKGS